MIKTLPKKVINHILWKILTNYTFNKILQIFQFLHSQPFLPTY